RRPDPGGRADDSAGATGPGARPPDTGNRSANPSDTAARRADPGDRITDSSHLTCRRTRCADSGRRDGGTRTGRLRSGRARRYRWHPARCLGRAGRRHG
ncbi:hypothetical protein DLJ47_16980, partial [Micromonospora sp. S4605]